MRINHFLGNKLFMQQEDYKPEFTRTYEIAAERLFRAWTDPNALRGWFSLPGIDQSPHVENDLRTGGDYRIDLQWPDGRTTRISGLYHDINEPVRLAFTWRWGDETDAEDTFVELRFRQLGPTQTELALLHDEFLTAAQRDRHEANWAHLLDRLAAYCVQVARRA